MLRASSEMAVATTARSVVANPQCDASSRPFWRAAARSAGQAMGTRTSSAMGGHLLAGALPLAVKVRKAFFQVQRGRDALEREPELDHRERHVRLNAHDDGLGPAEPDHVGDVAEGARRERVDDVEGGDVDDHAPRAHLADRHDQRVAELLEVPVGEGGLPRRDEIRALLEDRDLHETLAAATRGAASPALASARPCSPGAARPLRYRPGG